MWSSEFWLGSPVAAVAERMSRDAWAGELERERGREGGSQGGKGAADIRQLSKLTSGQLQHVMCRERPFPILLPHVSVNDLQALQVRHRPLSPPLAHSKERLQFDFIRVRSRIRLCFVYLVPMEFYLCIVWGFMWCRITNSPSLSLPLFSLCAACS